MQDYAGITPGHTSPHKWRQIGEWHERAMFFEGAQYQDEAVVVPREPLID